MKLSDKKTVVIGASQDPGRYSTIAIKMLHNKGIEVVALGLRKGTILGFPILTGRPEITDVHTVTLYIRPELQRPMYDYIFSLKPKRIIFNPGTENPEFEKKAGERGISTEVGCTLVMLSVGNY